MRPCDLSVSVVRVRVKDFLSWGQGSGQGQGLSQCGMSGECLKASCHEDTRVNCESGS